MIDSLLNMTCLCLKKAYVINHNTSVYNTSTFCSDYGIGDNIHYYLFVTCLLFDCVVVFPHIRTYALLQITY